MRFPSFIATLAFLALSFAGISTASAHTVVLKNWCGVQVGGPTPVAQFNFTGDQLRTLVDNTINSIQMANDAEDNGEPIPSVDGKCGIVDVLRLAGSDLRASELRVADDWTKTNVAITLYCNQFELNGYDEPMPYIPASNTTYVSSSHHTTYRITSGLKGSCMACPMQLAPITSG